MDIWYIPRYLTEPQLPVVHQNAYVVDMHMIPLLVLSALNSDNHTAAVLD